MRARFSTSFALPRRDRPGRDFRWGRDIEPFVWNKHDVCLNPITERVSADYRHYAEAMAAQTPAGRWVSARHIKCGANGGGGLPYLHDQVTFDTKREALDYAWKEIRERLGRLDPSLPGVYMVDQRQYNRLVGMVAEKRTGQLELFGEEG